MSRIPRSRRRDCGRCRQLKKSWYIFFFQLPRIPEWALGRNGCAAIAQAFRGMAVDKSRFPDEVLEVYRNAAALPGALTAMLNYYRALIRGLGRARRRGTPRIEAPTLMIWGEVDSALGKELSYGTDEYVADLTLRYLPNVSPLGSARSTGNGQRNDRGVASRQGRAVCRQVRQKPWEMGIAR